MEITKFRAWDYQTKQMLFHKLGENHWYTKENKAVIFAHNDHHETALKTRLSKPMQFINFCDNDKKEIYEGDIFKVPAYYCGDYENPADVGVVEFNELCFYIKGKQHHDLWHIIVSEKANVIGNIYESPELLNG